MNQLLYRRRFLAALASAASAASTALHAADKTDRFELKYIVGSCMYGYERLENLVPEIPKTGSKHLDLWPRVHGNQREQLDELGEAAFIDLLQQHQVKLGCITQYKLGPFALHDEMKLANRLGCRLIVTGGEGPKGLSGTELKAAIGQFIEKMKPHLEVAEANNVTIAIENHANNLFETADSLRYLTDMRPNRFLATALAPYHLPQDSQQLAQLITDLQPSLAMFYAWQHGTGCMQAQPKVDELKQMPGRGDLDFGPLVEALRKIAYQGWTEIFMHPYPRGLAILDTTPAVTAEINRAREYLHALLGNQD